MGKKMQESLIEEIEVKSISEPTTDSNGRTKSEKDKFKSIVKNFSEDEYKEAIRLFPDDCLWDELFRRNSKMLQRINQVEEVIGVSMDNIQPIPIVIWEEIRTRYFDLYGKFVRIRKMFGGN